MLGVLGWPPRKVKVCESALCFHKSVGRLSIPIGKWYPKARCSISSVILIGYRREETLEHLRHMVDRDPHSVRTFLDAADPVPHSNDLKSVHTSNFCSSFKRRKENFHELVLGGQPYAWRTVQPQTVKYRYKCKGNSLLWKRSNATARCPSVSIEGTSRTSNSGC